MRSTNYWLFGLWILVGSCGMLTLLGAFTIGIYFAPLAVILFTLATILSVRRPGRVHSTLGVLLPLPWAFVLVASFAAPVPEFIGLVAMAALASAALGVAFGVCEGRRMSGLLA
ncbi:hypothetical protein [Calidifontibacter terrae]